MAKSAGTADMSLADARLERFGGEASPEDQAAIGNALGIVENCADIDVDAAADFCAAAPKLLKWLLAIGSKKPTDNNKLAAAEVLAILVQTSDENKKRVGELGGIDALLRAVAPFKGKDPADEGEREVLENIFDVARRRVDDGDGQQARAFAQNEGLELMLMMMKSKRERASAIKCVDYARAGAPPRASGSWTSSGSRRRFPRAHGQGIRKVAQERGAEAVQEEEERAVSVVSSLFLHLA